MERDFSGLIPFIEETIPCVKFMGLHVEELQERDITLSMPIEPNINHVKIFYAGSIFTLLEVAGAALIGTTYDLFKYTVINKGMSIRYLRPATTKIYCHLTITKEEAEEKIRPIDEDGRGEWILDAEATDENDVIIAKSTCTYYFKVN